jgi:3-oxoacyl-(acyl-carrier-protein) synthase
MSTLLHEERARRVVITGLGVVAPNGIGKQAFWSACLAGDSGVRRITRFDASALPSQVAGEVVGFDPAQLGLSADEIRNMDRITQFGLAAAILAMDDADLGADALSQDERNGMGVFIGAAMGYFEEGERLWTRLSEQGAHLPRGLAAEDSYTGLFLAHAPAQAIAAHYGCHGPVGVIATGCSAGSDAIGQAFWAIQEGRADRMLAGGSDAAISPIALDLFCVMGAVSTAYNAEPKRASRPYDAKRDGFVMAEGAAVLLLEERELALARGATIYAEILGFASNCNAHHMTTLPEDGLPLQHLLRQVLAEANLPSSAIDYINSHGSSTPTNDSAETVAYKAVFGTRAACIPISATKSLIGHAQGAASAIEALVTALVMQQQWIPPTINQEDADPRCDLDYVPNVARQAAVNVALTHASGFGGVNSVLVLARPDWAGFNNTGTTYDR